MSMPFGDTAEGAKGAAQKQTNDNPHDNNSQPQSFYPPPCMSNQDRATLKTALATVLLVQRIQEGQVHRGSPLPAGVGLAPWLHQASMMNGTIPPQHFHSSQASSNNNSSNTRSASQHKHKTNNTYYYDGGLLQAGPDAEHPLQNHDFMDLDGNEDEFLEQDAIFGEESAEKGATTALERLRSQEAHNRFAHVAYMLQRAIQDQETVGRLAQGLVLHLIEILSELSEPELHEQKYDGLFTDCFLNHPGSGSVWQQLFWLSNERNKEMFVERFAPWIHNLLHSLWPAKSLTFDRCRGETGREHEESKDVNMLQDEQPQNKLPIENAFSLIPLVQSLLDRKHQMEPNDHSPPHFKTTAYGVYTEMLSESEPPDEDLLLEYYLRNLGGGPENCTEEEEELLLR